ncbi:hypothetical protein [Haloarchaeobius sp. DT45]|uniref:hypothetical protein n=1 Tax=Haloarchaeobius sp. DT45 TaxID=3446116 RepID=UPI003F6C272F
MAASAFTVGLCSLLAVGLWGLGRTRADATAPYDRLFAEVRFPTQSDGLTDLDDEVAASLAIAWLELTVLVLAGLFVFVVAAESSVPVALRALFVATFVVGAWLLGHALYVRLGLPVEGRLGETDGHGDRTLQRALAEMVGSETAADFATIDGALDTARGSDDRVDTLTVGLLAAAYNEADPAAVRRWAASTGVASPATVAARHDELASAGLLREESLQLRASRLATRGPTHVAAMASSLLS